MVVRKKKKLKKSRNVESEMCERVNMREIKKKMVHVLVNNFRSDVYLPSTFESNFGTNSKALLKCINW